MSASPLAPAGQLALDVEALRKASRTARERNRDMAEMLAEESGCQPEAAARAVASALGLQFVTVDRLAALAPDFDLLPLTDCLRRDCALVRDGSGNEDVLLALVTDPFDNDLLDWLAARVPAAFGLRLIWREDLRAFLSANEQSQALVASLLRKGEGRPEEAHAEEISLQQIAGDENEIVKLVNSTLYEALRQGASDVHIESHALGMQIKYRIDGVLARVGALQGVEQTEQVVSRIKVMAELDIAERRVPQDGRFRVALEGRDIDFRVSVMPSIHGEDVVLRVLDKEYLSRRMSGLTLAALGFDAETQHAIRRLANEPYGMLLVTGPTGSGKTTTLYATISEFNTGHDKIITIEDPVEYQLAGVLQIPVNEKKGLTFARGLRSILRHDPDRIMVGEIRDGETAEIAVQAALTGHLVFTTVHANNVFDVIGRFMHMKIDPHNLVSALNGVLAQRLVRVNCTRCATDEMPPPELLQESGLADVTGYRFRAGKGCGHCRGTGYQGRRVVAELLTLDDEMRELIVSRAPLRLLKEHAMSRGFRSLRQSGLALVASGETTLQELNRVSFSE